MFAFVLSLIFVFNNKASVRKKNEVNKLHFLLFCFLLSEEPNRGGVAAVSMIGCWI